MKKIVFLCLGLLTLINCKTLDLKEINLDKASYDILPEGLYANLKTNKGDMLVKFYEKESPVTVANFIGLAEGKIENKTKKKGEPFYDGTIFHRVIKGFMIQGGDPRGIGTGGPGYQFGDEKNDLKHSGKGVLSMANSGPDTNGSQFFITEVETPWLDGKHTIFGKVVRGEEVIDSIASVKTGAGDKPVDKVELEKVTVFTKGDEYKKYDAAKIFEEGKDKIEERNRAYIEKKEAEKQRKIDSLKSEMTETSSGLFYKITKKTDGIQPKAGDTVAVHYVGRLLSGTEFDNSIKRGEPIEFPVGVGRVIKGWDEGILLLKEGEEATFLIPPQLGYGVRGAGGVIPPNAWLLFDVELVKAK